MLDNQGESFQRVELFEGSSKSSVYSILTKLIDSVLIF
jgi:hypothetical protein